MIKDNYSFSEFGFSSKIIRDLTDEKEGVTQFVGDFFSKENVEKQINKKKFTVSQRKVLHDALVVQNEKTDLSKATSTNIKSLKSENTFTIVTGHQLNLLTGPLYSIYKIIQVIVWCEKLNCNFPEHHFVPMFWMATEDHDFEEINHIHLFNSKMEWVKEGQEDFIAGKIETKDFENFKTQVLGKFSDEILREKIEQFLKHYDDANLAKGTRSLLNEMFGEYGLVIIDGDDSDLKKGFYPIAKKELNKSLTFSKVSKTNAQLNEVGYHNQVFLRDCNLFYIDENYKRIRIVKVDNGFEINSKFYTAKELTDLAANFPERFSPNALLRPVYQETILPNLAYIGGGGEIAYWLQLKGVFEVLNLTYPLLRVRDSYILLSENDVNTIDDFGYSLIDLKQNIDDLTKAYTTENATSDISMDSELNLFRELQKRLEDKVQNKDLGLKRFIEGELVKIEKQLEKIEKKLIQNEKKNLDKSIKQIQRLKNKIYPQNGFQERYENMLQYVSKDDFISSLKKEVEQSMTVQPQIKLFQF